MELELAQAGIRATAAAIREARARNLTPRQVLALVRQWKRLSKRYLWDCDPAQVLYYRIRNHVRGLSPFCNWRRGQLRPDVRPITTDAARRLAVAQKSSLDRRRANDRNAMAAITHFRKLYAGQKSADEIDSLIRRHLAGRGLVWPGQPLPSESFHQTVSGET